MDDIIRCSFCGGLLGRIQQNKHNDSPGWTQYRTCLACGYQWSEHYWDSLRAKKAKNTQSEE